MINYLLLGLILLVLALLFVPLTFRGRGRLAASISGEIELAWAGGLIAARWLWNQPEKDPFVVRLGRWIKSRPGSPNEPRPTSSGATSAPAPPKQAPRNSEIKPQQRLRSIQPLLSKNVIKESWLFGRQIWKSLKLRWALEGEYGTEDPALTGAIAAGIAALNGLNGNLRLQANFEHSMLNLQGELRGRIVPALLVWECGRFMLKPPIRRIWWPMLTQKKLKNKGGV